MSKKHNTAHFQAIRRELAAELGYNPDRLTALESMRVDVVFGLKSTLDEMRARMFAGEQIDTNEMRQIADTLERYLPAATKPDPTPSLYRRDPADVMIGMVNRFIEARDRGRAERGLSPPVPVEDQQARIDELEAESAALRAQPALPAPDAAITPRDGDILPPGENSHLPQNQRYVSGQDNPKLGTHRTVVIDGVAVELRPGQDVVDGKVVAVPPRARSGAETKEAMARVNADIGTVARIMTEPSRVAGEPVPSTGPRIVAGSGELFRRSW